ncbi:MAG: PilZ domain-containing protein [Gammaproteobacteria bacterium]|nr:PilZ domain-containing protein [Gammaproteobacteria bacterium]
MTDQEKEQEWAIEDDRSEEDRRQYDRYSTDFYLCVHTRPDDRLLGDVIDISLGGLKLLSNEALRVGEIMSLQMDIALESGRQGNFEFQARAVWSGQDENPECYTTGFEFLNLSPQTRKILQDIIDELGD